MKGQISAELIIIIAAVLAVALVLVLMLKKTTEEEAKIIEKKTDAILEETKKIGEKKLANGKNCKEDSDCISNYCDPWEKKCREKEEG